MLQTAHTDIVDLTQEFQNEIEFMCKIRHANLITFFGGGILSNGSPFLVLEWAPRGSLRNVLEDVDLDLAPALKVNFAMDTCRGMSFLHEKLRMHRDLKVRMVDFDMYLFVYRV